MSMTTSAVASDLRAQLERVLGFRVLQWPGEYVTALTHKSAVGTPGAGTRSFEKLEFLGDAVLGFVVGRYLYDAYPDADEGFLTQLRTKLVSGQALAQVARRMGISDLILMSPKALRQNFHTNPRILEDVFESLVGAVFLDAGMAAAREFALRAIHQHIDRTSLVKNTNYKDQAMQYCQARAMDLPVYAVVREDRGTFMVSATFAGCLGTGSGRTKRAAEQAAARAALVALEVPVD
jgi:ribonuclease III